MLKDLKLLHAPQTELILDDCAHICLEAIPDYKSWEEMRLVWQHANSDLLFHVRDKTSNEFALRILGERSYDYYSRTFQYQSEIDHTIAAFSSSSIYNRLRYGLCRGNRYVYFIMPWQHDVCFQEVVNDLSFHEKLKPAADAAAYIRAASSIGVVNKWTDSDMLSFADSSRSSFWQEQIDSRVARVRHVLCRRGLDIAALEHFRRFYRCNRCLLADREMQVCYNNFVPENWYFQPDGSITIPLISDWVYADKWYSLSRLLSEIHLISEDFAILLVDFCFAFKPTEEFFICCAIYNMLSVLEELAVCNDLNSPAAKMLIMRVRSIDHMYAKFTSAIPSWYKKVSSTQRLNDSIVSNPLLCHQV